MKSLFCPNACAACWNVCSPLGIKFCRDKTRSGPIGTNIPQGIVLLFPQKCYAYKNNRNYTRNFIVTWHFLSSRVLLSSLRHSACFQSITQRSLCTNHTQVITVHSRTLARRTKTTPKPKQCPKNNRLWRGIKGRAAQEMVIIERNGQYSIARSRDTCG
jgi:hypothetical protein